MKKKRILIAAVTLLILSFFIAGCAENSIDENGDQQLEEPTVERPIAETAAPEPTPTSIPEHLLVSLEDVEDIEVHFMHPWLGDIGSTLETITEAFNRENAWGITVSLEGFGSEFHLLDALQTRQETGDTPALIAVHPYLLTDRLPGYMVVNLIDYFNHPEWGYDADEQADFFSALFAPYEVGDGLIALPLMPQATVIFYNQTWAEELGSPSLPDDHTEFQSVTCAAAFQNWRDNNPSTDGTGGWVLNLDPKVLAGWYLAFDGDLPNETIPVFDNDAAFQAYSYLWNAREEGCFWVAREPEPYFYASTRLALAFAGTLDQIPAQIGWQEIFESEDEWTAMGFPGPAGEKIVVDGPPLLLSAGTPEEQLAAWLFAKYLMEPAVQAQLVEVSFTLPVRESAVEYLEDFTDEYPQWAAVMENTESMHALPISDKWGIAQWVLQDAVFRMMQTREEEISMRLTELDLKVSELEALLP